MTGITGCASVMGGASEDRAERAPNQYVTVGETKFAYRSFGQGAPVIFLNRFRATMDHWDPAFVNAVARASSKSALNSFLFMSWQSFPSMCQPINDKGTGRAEG